MGRGNGSSKLEVQNSLESPDRPPPKDSTSEWKIRALAISVFLNVMILLALMIALSNNKVEDSQRENVKEAERCNIKGHYNDLIMECECFACFEGTTCAHEVPPSSPMCFLDAGSGNPLIFQDFWDTASSLTTVITPSWHM